MRYVNLDGYIVIKTTEAAVCVKPENGPVVYSTFRQPIGTWLPRRFIEGGYALGRGDTDIRVERWIAEKEDLTFN